MTSRKHPFTTNTHTLNVYLRAECLVSLLCTLPFNQHQHRFVLYLNELLKAHCSLHPPRAKANGCFVPPPTNDTESISKTNSRHRIRKQSKRTATAVAPTVNYSPQRLLSDQNIKSISAGRRNV